jgi:PadR family transcriptional regulator, regulatory protein PadR
MHDSGMKISKDLNAASASAIVLGILQTGECYGYAIVQKVRELSGGEVEWTDGMLYPILHRLEADGLIVARWGESETGRKRKYYQLTLQARPVMEDDRRQWQTVHAILNRLWATEASPRSPGCAPATAV